MRTLAIVILAACGGAEPAPTQPSPRPATLPLAGLEAVALGDTVAAVKQAFPGAEVEGDRIYVDHAVVEGRPASLDFAIPDGVVSWASVNFGEVCDHAGEVQVALDARFGATGALESYVWTWHLAAWDVTFYCQQADTSGWLTLIIKPAAS